MRYPKKKPLSCSISFYVTAGTEFCHNTLQKIEDGTCRKCVDHYRGSASMGKEEPS